MPLVEYARNFYLTILLCVFVSVGMVGSALFSPMACVPMQAICYMWPIC